MTPHKKEELRPIDPVLADLLEAFSLPHIEDRLSREFFYRLGLRFPQQYGIACRDVAASVRRAEALGAGPFLHVEVEPPNWMEHGERRRCRLEVALGYAGDAQIEFLGPGEGTDHYAKALIDRDIVLHHVGIYQRGLNRIAGTLESAGYPAVVRGGLRLGPALTIDFRYFGTAESHGVYVEVIDLQAFGRTLSEGAVIRGYAAVQKRLSVLARRRRG